MQRLSVQQSAIIAALFAVAIVCVSVLVARGQVSPAYLTSLVTLVGGWCLPPPSVQSAVALEPAKAKPTRGT